MNIKINPLSLPFIFLLLTLQTLPAQTAEMPEDPAVTDVTDVTEVTEGPGPAEVNAPDDIAGASSPADVTEDPASDALTDEQTELYNILSASFLQAEDPTQIYDIDLGDSRVDFYLDGSWALTLKAATDFVFKDGVGQALFSPPVIEQTVDLSTWIFIDNRWYFEASFMDGFTRNTFALGYLGPEESPIREIRAGNSGIVFPDRYPYITVGGGAIIAPGIMGTFSGATWKADAIVRYDTVAQQEMRLSGMNELIEEYRPVSAWNRATRFVLPDNQIAAPLEVFVRDDNGQTLDSSGGRWRRLNAIEYSLDSLQGVLTLESPAPAGVAARYNGDWHNGFSAPGTSLIDFYDETIAWFDSSAAGTAVLLGLNPAARDALVTELDGQAALLLYQDGIFSPFELGAFYSGKNSSEQLLELVFAETGERPADFALAYTNDAGGGILLYNSARPASLRSAAGRFPLAEIWPLFYANDSPLAPAETSLSIRNGTWEPITEINLGALTLAGTIQVERNGIPDTAFDFEETTGKLELATPPATGENIRIRWQTMDPGARSATLRAALGAQKNIGEHLSIFTASSLIWTHDPEGYSDYHSSAPGTLTVSAGGHWQQSGFSFKTEAAMELAQADTTGFFRIAGMDGQRRTLAPEEDWYRAIPGSLVPDLSTAVLLELALPPPALLASDRVAIRDSDGDKLPSISATGISGKILLFETTLPAADSWSAADIMLSEASVDFRSIESLTLTLKNNRAALPGWRLFLQIGTGLSQYSENNDVIVTRELSIPPEAADWQRLRIALTDAERSRLGSAGNIRLVALCTTAGETVSLYSGPIILEEKAFSLILPAAPSSAAVRSVSDPAVSPLQQTEPEPAARFNPSGANRVLELEISEGTDGTTFRAEKITGDMPLESYDSFGFFINRGNLPSSANIGDIIVSLSRTASFTATPVVVIHLAPSALQSNQWQRVEVNLEKGTIELDGAALDGAQGTVDVLNRTLRPQQIAVDLTLSADQPATSPSLRLYVDEFYFSEPRGSLRFLGAAGAQWQKEEALGAIWPASIITHTVLKSDIQLSYAPEKPEVPLSLTGSASTKVAAVQLQGSLAASGVDTVAPTQISHSIIYGGRWFAISETLLAVYPELYLRRDNRIGFPLLWGFFTQGSLIKRGLFADRSLTASLTPPKTKLGAAALNGSLTTVFKQNGADGLGTIEDQPYGTLWTDSISLYRSIGEEDAQSRAVNAALKTAVETPAVLFRMDYESGVIYNTVPAAAYTTTQKLNNSLTWKIGLLNLTPWWERSGEEKSGTVSGGNWPGDIDFLGKSLARTDWFFLSAPIADLIDPELQQRLYSTSGRSLSFVNTYGVRASRSSTGSVQDLYLPVTLETSISRSLATTADITVRDSREFKAGAGFSAINMFGAWGSLQKTTAWQEDEFSADYRLAVQWGAGFVTASFDTDHALLLFTGKDWSVRAANNWHYNTAAVSGTGERWEDKITLSWKRTARTSFLQALITNMLKTETPGFRENTAAATCSETDRQGLLWSAELTHALTAMIGENGEIRIDGGISLNRPSMDIVIAGIKASVTGVVRY